MTLKEIRILKPIYIIPKDDLPGEVLIPCMQVATAYDCMSGFFNSKALKELAPGLADFLSNSTGTMRLLISPNISLEDQKAIERGLNNSPEDLEAWLLEKFKITTLNLTSIERFTLECLSYLISSQRIEIKIVLIKNGLFHPKVWLISDDHDTIIIHGSSNSTGAGLKNNYENLRVEKSWVNSEAESVRILAKEFKSNWNNENKSFAKVFSFPDAIKKDLIKNYKPVSVPTPADYWDALDDEDEPIEIVVNEPIGFEIPDGLIFDTGDFAHQGDAVKAWEEADSKGILSMATGSGKTITSLICAHRLYSEVKPLLIIISAPYLPLINQWSKEVIKFGLTPIVPGNASSRSAKLKTVSEGISRLRYEISDVECMIVTNALFCNKEFIELMSNSESKILFIADEMHHLGTENSLSALPEFIDFRLGLSATPVRQYDEEGTEGLIEYFREVVFEYSLKEAIGNCLVPYYYYVHPVALSDVEMEEWLLLTEKIKKLGWTLGEENKNRKSSNSSHIDTLIRRRRKVLEQAEGKLPKLKELLLDQDPKHIRHTLIYASEKGREQLEQVNSLLINDLDILMHQITSKETQSGLSNKYLNDFSTGESLQVLTAMKVLDEGVDIPQIKTAYILASTTVERQWVQRRGRVLRKCESINKKHSTIHDFFVFGSGDDSFNSIIQSEAKRIYEFGKLAINAFDKDGPIQTIDAFVEGE